MKIITSRARDLGGFSVRRLLPYMSQRMVGAFIFFDHMGPAEFGPGHGINVRPHPHMNLATVTYLFEGMIDHHDSLGSRQLIEPGAINWMTAGRGIVHSERTPAPFQNQSKRLNGIQCWVALPEKFEEIEPHFSHHPKDSLPDFSVGGAKLKLLLGQAFGHTSPVPVHSDLFYLDVILPKGSIVPVPLEGREAAAYLVEGAVLINGQPVEPCSMAIHENEPKFEVQAQQDSRLMLLGGTPVGPRFIFWNLVSSSQARIDEAKKDWALGPRADSPRFQPIPSDNNEFIPLSEEPNPKGTIL